MIAWEQFIKDQILAFRENYKKLGKEQTELVKKDKRLFITTLNRPCQVVVIDFNKPYPTCFVVMHNMEHPDMEIVTLENVAFEVFSIETLKKVKLIESLNIREIQRIYETIKKETPYYTEEKMAKSFSPLEESLLVTYGKARSLQPFDFSNTLQFINYVEIQQAWRKKQKSEIEQTVGDIRRDAETIPVEELRTKILEASERLEGQINQLGKRVDDEVSRLRKVIGTSEKYLDWKAFTADLEHLKKTHITKEAFDAHIKRIDEKIDKGLKALNTRIEDLKAIKFWSKRTIVDIILAIIATASTTIVTLIVAGILKF